MTVLGIDISKWDGNWDANKAKQGGAAFVFIKASQANFTDTQFVANWKKAKDAGLLRGAYHYLDYSKPALSQAKYFGDLLQADPGELPPTVDYEHARSDNDPDAALAFLRDFLNAITSRTELFTHARIKVPMVYTGPSFWAEYGDQTNREYWTKFPLWLANYTTAAAPSVPAPWTMWNFWQFTAKGPGEVFGSESLSIDMNRFNGTSNELYEFLGLPVPVAEVVETTAPLTLEKRVIVLEEAISKLKLSSDGQLVTRVDALEQQLVSLAQSLNTSHSQLDGRLTTIEQGNPTAAPAVVNVSQPAPTTGTATTSTVSTLPPAPAPTPAPAPIPGSTPVNPALYATCKVNALNVRSGAGTGYPAIAQLSMAQTVKVLERNNGWVRIEDPAGWVYEPYLSYEQNAPAAAGATTGSVSTVSTAAAIYGICNTSGLNVRSSPGATYPIVGGLTYGQRVKILERSSGWARIEAPAGWCNENYLSFNVA